MAGGYPRPSGDDLWSQLAAFFAEVKRQLRELQTSTGTQITDLVAQVKAKLAELDATVNALVAAALANYYTKAQTDSKVANPGTIAPTHVNATGDVNMGGALRAQSVYNTTLSSSYRAVWCTSVDGQLGYVPSSERFKQDIRFPKIDLDALARASVIEYRYKEAVSEFGDKADWVLGGSAEQFMSAGLGHTVSLDEDGLPFGIEDRPLLYTLLAGYQKLAARVAELEAQN